MDQHPDRAPHQNELAPRHDFLQSQYTGHIPAAWAARWNGPGWHRQQRREPSHYGFPNRGTKKIYGCALFPCLWAYLAHSSPRSPTESTRRGPVAQGHGGALE